MSEFAASGARSSQWKKVTVYFNVETLYVYVRCSNRIFLAASEAQGVRIAQALTEGETTWFFVKQGKGLGVVSMAKAKRLSDDEISKLQRALLAEAV